MSVHKDLALWWGQNQPTGQSITELGSTGLCSRQPEKRRVVWEGFSEVGVNVSLEVGPTSYRGQEEGKGPFSTHPEPPQRSGLGLGGEPVGQVRGKRPLPPTANGPLPPTLRFVLVPSLHPDWTLLLFFLHTHSTVTTTLALIFIPKVRSSPSWL